MAHTPGPWIWHDKIGSLYQVGEPPHTYGQPVMTPTYEYDTGLDIIVSDADARLIAAAPDLLSALTNFLEAIGGEESTDIWCVDARAAIARATGDV